jgi:hypothetical protein
MLKLIDVTGKPPKRKGKPKPNLIDNMDAFLQLKSIILNDKMNPHQELALFFGPQEVKELNQKFPWRVAVDRLRRLIKSVGLESEYRIRKYETDTRGVWAVLVQRIKQKSPPSGGGLFLSLFSGFARVRVSGVQEAGPVGWPVLWRPPPATIQTRAQSRMPFLAQLCPRPPLCLGIRLRTTHPAQLRASMYACASSRVSNTSSKCGCFEHP